MTFVIILPVRDYDHPLSLLPTLTASYPTAVFELRLDYLPDLNPAALAPLIADYADRLLLTLRRPSDGGQFPGDENTRLACLRQLAELQPGYLDLEADIGAEFITEIKRLAPKTQLVRSYHNFKQTPADLAELLQTMQHPDISIYKIISYAHSSLDSLRMLNFIKQHASQQALIGHCMGECGRFSRILGHVLGNHWTYAGLTHESVLTDLYTIDELTNLFHLPEKNSATQCYALLGDPVTHSRGEYFHNGLFTEHGFNGLYVKIKLTAAELPTFFSEIAQLPFVGFSVTMPLKQAVVPYVQDQENFGTLNTLKKIADTWYGVNTDGIGALLALEKKIQLSPADTVLIIGASATAVAIIHVLQKLGVKLLIANRTYSKAELLAERYAAMAVPFGEPLDTALSLVINTLPPSAYSTDVLVWTSSLLTNKPLVMDVNYNRDTNSLAQLCAEQHCAFMDGYDMFMQQGLQQSTWWRQS